MQQHQPRRRFGQNFLIDQNVIDRIVQVIAPKSGDHIIEIGPGLGALTKAILPRVGAMDVIELDRDLIPKLSAATADNAHLTIHQADALTFDFTQFAKQAHSLRIIGNLPYNISTPLLFHLILQRHVIKDMHFMLQKEVVERMCAEKGNKNYGRLTVMVQYYCKVEYLFTVNAHAFKPAPKVKSAFVRLIPQTFSIMAKDLTTFNKVVSSAFMQRRKTLRNCLKNIVTAEQLETLHIDSNLRPEQLSVEDFVRISNVCSDTFLTPVV